MKEWIVKNKKMIFTFAAVMVLAIAAVIACFMLTQEKPANDTEGNKQVVYEFEHYELKEVASLNNYDDIGLMIADFDSAELFETQTGMKFTSKKNQYVQGVGALDATNMRYMSFPMGTFQPIDISAYAKGSVHLAVYVNNPVYLGETGLVIELSSSGKNDKEELSWFISASFLQPGWNDLYLGIESATRVGEPNLAAINYFRAYNLSVDTCAEIYLDAMYATDTEGMDLNTYPSTKPGYLMDFDSVDALTAIGTMSFTNEPGMYKEGAGAVKVVNPGIIWMSGIFKPVDLSGYQKVSFWLYVDDAAYVGESFVVVELTSAGKSDNEEVFWQIPGAGLSSGWNEIVLRFDAGNVGSEQKINMTNVNFFRIWATGFDEKVTIAVDGLKPEKITTRVASDGMITACDTTSDFDSVSGKITNAEGEYKQGTGAIKSTYSDGKLAIWTAALRDLVDVSHCAEGGITFWLYVDDVSSVPQGVYFEIRSGGKSDTDEYQWLLSNLKNGWNEIRLPFRDATIAGQPDLTKLYTMRLHAAMTGQVTFIIDAIRAVEDASEATPEGTTNDSAVEGMLFSGDSFRYLKLLNIGKNEITREEGEYKQGTGAYKSMGAGVVRLQGLLYEPKNLSAYQDGGIQFSLYIEDKSVIDATALMVELTSAGTHDKEEVMWVLPLTSLADGWNTVNMMFEDANATGTIDLTQVDYMRIYFFGNAKNEEILLIMDNIHAIRKEDIAEDVPSDSTDDSTVEGMLFSGDSMDYMKNLSPGRYEITREEGEYKQGTGAYKSMGSGVVRLQGLLHKSKDLSAYAEGGIQFSLYIEDKSVIESTALMFELTSAGKHDEEELLWVIPLANLNDGWNTVTMMFDKASPTGSIDLTQVDYMRIYFFGSATSEDIALIIDDIHAIHDESDNPGGSEQPDGPEQPDDPDNPQNPEQGELTTEKTDEYVDKKWSPFI